LTWNWERQSIDYHTLLEVTFETIFIHVLDLRTTARELIFVYHQRKYSWIIKRSIRSFLISKIPNFQIEDIKNKEIVLFIGEVPIKDTPNNILRWFLKFVELFTHDIHENWMKAFHRNRISTICIMQHVFCFWMMIWP